MAMVTGKGKKPNKPKPSQTVVNRASKNQQQRRQSSNMFGAVGGYKGVDQNMVRQLINQTVRPELMAMRGDRRYINRQADNATADANSLYGRSVGDLNYVFGEAGDYINSLGGQINSGYDQTAQKIAGANASGQAQMQANTNAATAAIQNQLSALGLGNAGVDPRLTSDAAFSQNQAVQQGANEAANLAASQQSANTMTQLLGGMIAGSKASNLGQAAQNRMTGINDINRAKQDDMASVNDAMRELRASKPGMIREMLLQLQAQGFDQWQAIQSLNMSRRAMNMDAAQDSSYYGTAAQAWGAQAGAGSSSGTGSPGSSAPGSFNPVWTPNASPGSKPGGRPNKGGRKGGRRGTGSQNDAIYGPLAGGYS